MFCCKKATLCSKLRLYRTGLAFLGGNSIRHGLGNLLSVSFFCLLFTTSSSITAQVKFIQNKGQWPEKALYKASLSQGDLWLTDSGLLFSLWDPAAAEQMHNRSQNRFLLKRHAFYLHFQGGHVNTVVPTGPASEEYYNYFLGNDPSHWASGIHAYESLMVPDLYPGIDLELLSENGTLKYNLICRKPENLKLVKLQYLGVDSLQLHYNHLEVYTTVAQFSDAMPLVTGESDAGTKPVKANYVLYGNTIGVELAEDGPAVRYQKLTIDPVLVFSTYSGSKADNFGCTGTYDDQGNGFSGGTVFGVGFPISIGAFQTVFGGGKSEGIGYGDARDAGILKFSADGKSLKWATYLGGTDNEQPHSMIADKLDNLYIMGSTRSSNFPVTASAFDRSQNGDYDFFVAKLSADGKSLLASTFIGGSGLDAVGADRENTPIDDFTLLYNYADEFRGEIITDGNNVYVSGITYSPGFPRSNNSGWFGGKEDGCVFSFTADLSTLRWSQLVGSNGFDAFYGITLGRFGDLYASGGSSSQNLDQTFSSWNNKYIGGIADGMVVRFRQSDGKLLQGRYLGTSEYEQAYFAQIDNSGNPYCFGQTEGSFPIVNSPYNQPGTGQFIVRLDTNLGNVTLSTSFGGNNNKPNISPSAFLVDQCERIFVSGWGGSVNAYLDDFNTFQPKKHRNTGNTYNLPISANATQKATDGSDFYIAVFEKNMNSLLFSTYFGGISTATKDAEEHVDGGTSRFDKKGIIYQSVCAGCGKNGLFPTTPGAYSRSNNSYNCNNALFKIDFENLNKKPFMNDTFVQGVATDLINFSMIAHDPDRWDTLMLQAFLIQKAGSSGADTPKITLKKGVGKADFSFVWNTQCNSWSKDTLTLKIMVYDKGCPKADTNWATIKVLITEPPKVIPPDAICVSFDRASGQLKVSWPATTQSSRFFSHFIMKRQDPGGVVTDMLKITNTNAGSFTDMNVLNPNTNNYCYWLEGYNTCGVMVKALIPFCTVTELNNPINGVHVKFATVENDKRVKLEWEMSHEPDFKEYEVYRYPRGGSAGKIPYLYSTDTSILDSMLNVDAESMCYAIVVTDKCGHASIPSNQGCNVVIGGSATGRPQYYFDLSWQDYLDWQNGVQDWTLERQYASNPWSVVANTGQSRVARDNKLDYDWGGYWYRVTATESLKGQARPAYTSQSNWIYLYQPPELWVPNAFTADGNGINDVWGTVPVFVRNYNMKVYNRWGQKVWESDAKKRQWDGTVNGKLAEDGVFAWYVVFDGWDDKTYTMSGTVTIIH